MTAGLTAEFRNCLAPMTMGLDFGDMKPSHEHEIKSLLPVIKAFYKRQQELMAWKTKFRTRTSLLARQLTRLVAMLLRKIIGRPRMPKMLLGNARRQPEHDGKGL